MCYTVSFIERKSAAYAERYKNEVPIGWADLKNSNIELPLNILTNAFTNHLLPIVTNQGLLLANWGLIPHWISTHEKAAEIRNKTLNAVGETIFEKASFKKSVISKRCLLPVSGFFEWMHLGKEKYPYFIYATTSKIFSLGCIYDSWFDSNSGLEFLTFSIVTTPANSLMAKIHNTKKRMPFIVQPDDEINWINPNLSNHEIADMIQPFNENKMKAYPIGKNILSINVDDKNILTPINYPELELLND